MSCPLLPAFGLGLSCSFSQSVVDFHRSPLVLKDYCSLSHLSSPWVFKHIKRFNFWTWRSISLRMILTLSYLLPFEGIMKIQIIRPLLGNDKLRNHFNMGDKRKCLYGMYFGNSALFLWELKFQCSGQDASSSSIFYCPKCPVRGFSLRRKQSLGWISVRA